jgi:hypothetical protein
MSSFRRFRSPAAALLAILSTVLAAPAVAEVVVVGDPFPLGPRPIELLTGSDIAWLPPGAGGDQPAGFFVVWGELIGSDSIVYRAFVPQDAGTPPEPPVAVAGPDSFSNPRVATGPDRRSAVVFAGGGPPDCYGGFLYGPAMETEAALRPVEPGPCFQPFLDAALLPDGRLVVVYDDQVSQIAIDLVGQFFARDGEAVGEPFPVAREQDMIRVREVVAAPGGFLVFSVDRSQNRFDPFGASALRVQRFDLQGEPLAEPLEIAASESLVSHLSVVPVAGGWIAVWTELGLLPQEGVHFREAAFARRLDATGAPVGPPHPLLVDVDPTALGTVDAAPGPGETVLLGWSVDTGAGPEVEVQLLTAELAAAGERVTLATGARLTALDASPAGDALAVWREEGGPLVAQRLAVEAECTPSATVLCLQGGRFEVSVEWADFQGNAGPGRRVPVASDDSGLFWFFHPENWEMLVKVLDACPLDGHFWVFAAAATNVEYTLTVSDLVAHQTRIFRNDLGDTARALTVTDAFPTCGAAEGEAGGDG